MTKKYLLLVILQSIMLCVSAQEFWSGTKSTSSTISRTGETNIGSLSYRFSGNTAILEHAAPTGDFYIRSVAYNVTGDAGNIILNDISGNVGIGTAKPRGSLHIAQSNLTNTPLAPIVLSRYWLDDTQTRASSIFHYSDGSNEKLVFAVAGLGGTYDSPISLSQAKMIIQANGNVGIGVITPKQKLSVNGTIQGREVNVTTTDWPDYVFDKDYVLPSPEDLSQQIQQQGHLPGMPSAAELQEKGIDVGNLLNLQQKKIEELTLYMIEQQKEIKALKEKFEQLQNARKDENQ